MQFENFSRLFIILIVVLSAQHTLNVYAECIEGNCVNGKGTLTSPDGFKYVGEWKNGQPHGRGTMTFPDGEKYVGELKEGEPNGQGTFTSPDVEEFVGESKDQKQHKGTISTMTYTVAGLKYVGEWKNGKPHGQGTLTSPEGSAKIGIWRNGEPISDNCKEKGLRPNTRAYQRCLLKLID